MALFVLFFCAVACAQALELCLPSCLRSRCNSHHNGLQDIEVTRGYVPGYHGVLGHEFVGRVERCSSRPELQGQRVVGEINCNDGGFSCADAAYQRNHAPGR
eukprot:GHRQ01028468.1.p1 GENE.GHRQ01028468.1~~GHRQ01028468.1.p1  ORF type:complete len:102 (+),score=16.32 GHRQ01028468.1:102-407(+)